MSQDNPLVSIIVRTKDRPKLLERALQSIAAQTYRPIEVVLVNDGGCDLDVKRLKELLEDVSINYQRLKSNTGRAHAGNTGLAHARGEYIGFLDDDDEFYPEHVSLLVSLLRQVNYRVVYSDSLMAYKEYNPATSELIDIRKEVVFSQDFNYDYLIFENYIPFMCLLFERDVLRSSGGFDEGLDIYEDWELLIRIGERYPFYHIAKKTADYNQWDTELQIAQSNKNHDFMEQSYLKVVSKHIDKVSAKRILSFSSHLADKYKGPYIKAIEALLAEMDTELNNVYNSRGWRMLSVFYRARDAMRSLSSGRMRQETKGRFFAQLLLKMTMHPKDVFRNLTRTNIHKFLYYLKAGDPLTLGKKIEQKLSDEDGYGKASTGKQPNAGLPEKTLVRNYFGFMSEMNTNRAEDHVPLSYPDIPKTDIKLIAFYLPQFHPIPENDEWWGKGFTEWTNVVRAVPQFIGHYQPRLPGELGFYDLRVPEVQQRQAELARQYGMCGFCFHFYWFNGRTLLERPIKEYVENIDFPFCLNWANENWTRRWDGKENEILMAQRHSPEDDIEFIKYISAYLKHKNYIRIDSKPLLIVYRPALLPSPKETAARWRGWCRENGIGEIYLVAMHSFEHINPESIGFDAAIDFPPNTFPLNDISDEFIVTNPNFKGVLLDYRKALEFSRNYSKPPYKKFRGICPSWDNESRKPGRGTVLVNSTPDIFKQWLKILCRFTEENFEPDERMIFVNAWNEWAEGAYLEPDRRYGYAYLQAVADALIEHGHEEKQKRILYVCHDAHFHGAQLLSLSILRVLKLKFNYEVHFLLKSGGELEPEYAKYGHVYNLERAYGSQKEREKLVEYFYSTGIREAICNTVASGDLAQLFYEKGIRTITLVHELPDIIRKMGLEKNARLLSRYSDRIVFPSGFVRERFKTIAKPEDGKTTILPQGVYKDNRYKHKKDEARKELRKRFSLPEDAQIILGVGFGDHRKGFDLFVEVAKMVGEMPEHENIYFMWVGNLHDEMKKKIEHEIRSNKKIILQSAVKDVDLFYAGADIFVLTSREDPFPAVVLEAMDVGLPVIGFSEAGGFEDIVNASTGALVPYLDVAAMSREIIGLVTDTQRREMMEGTTQKMIEEKFNFSDYVYRLLALAGHEFKKVSVIVPNYNYEKYLKLRIGSILRQTYPVCEIIFLDDASTDNSVRVAEEYLKKGLDVRIIRNETNSGSAFTQWVKGLQMARGDYIWIAEADDLCEDTFLEELLACFAKDKDVSLAYCQSRQIDEEGKVVSENYYEYTNDIDRKKWHDDYIRDGIHEIADTLAVKNSIPNVSAVVFRNVDVSSIANEITNFRIAGDWFFYVRLLASGKIAYVSRSLNSHRRHDRGITKSEDKEVHFHEVVRMQEHIMKNFDVAEEVRDKVYVYREYLANYFGLNKKRAYVEI